MKLNRYLTRWLLVQRMPYPSDLSQIMTMGSGPFKESWFDSLLKRLGIMVFGPSNDIEILVLGREDWRKEQIHEILDGRSGLHLRAYSQEMFLAYLISGADPLSEDEEIVRQLAGDHPGLSFLEDVVKNVPCSELKFTPDKSAVEFIKGERFT